MKRHIIFSVLIIIGLLPGNAQLLWKISGNKLKHDSYLFGTHHLVSNQFLDSIPGIFPAFNRAEKIVSEIVLNNLDVMTKIQQAATLPDSLTMNHLLDSADYKLVDNELKNSLHFGLTNLDKLHPAMILTIYTLAVYKEKSHLDDNPKLDSYFQIVAAEKGVPVVGLETVEKQIEILFPKDDLKKQARELVLAVKKRDVLYKEVVEMNNLYRTGNIAGLYGLSQQSNKEWGITGEEYAEMVDNRNEAWALQLPDLLKGNRCFIAVGALHLPGEKGLINLLRKSGYKVTPVTVNMKNVKK